MPNFSAKRHGYTWSTSQNVSKQTTLLAGVDVAPPNDAA